MGFANILIVGCGNMAGAMLRGWLAAGFEPARFTIVSPSEKPFPVAQMHGLPIGGHFDAVLLGVKPQKLDEVAAGVARIAGHRTSVLSLLAGVDLATLRDRFPAADAVVRVMPNLAVAIGKSPIALAADGHVAQIERDLFQLLAPLGTPEWVGEDRFDLVTALAGSGPAFIYRIIQTLGDAAAELGLPADQAHRLALAMVDGAAALAAASADDPATLARKVASPGGTTQAGLDVLDADGRLVALMRDTLAAARDRSAAMREEARRAAS